MKTDPRIPQCKIPLVMLKILITYFIYLFREALLLELFPQIKVLYLQMFVHVGIAVESFVAVLAIVQGGLCVCRHMLLGKG